MHKRGIKMEMEYDLTISQAAEQLGCHRLTLLNWEKRGLIKPARDINNFRRYSQEQIEDLKKLFELRRTD